MEHLLKLGWQVNVQGSLAVFSKKNFTLYLHIMLIWRLQNELYEVIDLTAPEKTSPQHRLEKKFADEEKKFNTDHYM